MKNLCITFVFSLPLLLGVTASVREAVCTYKVGMWWQEDCTVVYVSLRDPQTNFTANTAMLLENQDDTKAADLDRIKISLGNMVTNYQDVRYRDMLDIIQTRHMCCGSEDYNDWGDNSDYACSGGGSLACGVPRSCCKRRTVNCGAGALNPTQTPNPGENIHTRGCAGQLRKMSICFTKDFDTKSPSPDGFQCYYDDSEKPVRTAFRSMGRSSGSPALTASVAMLLLLQIIFRFL